MKKERLELFSDGVFAIILTLLVLDLKVPHGRGLDALREATPGLALHALTFFAVGVSWINHHATLAHLKEITQRTLLLNLLFLFWVTLLPFGVRVAAEDQWSAFGGSVLAGCTVLGQLSLLLVVLSARSSVITLPHMAAWRRRRWTLMFALMGVGLICAVASFAWPPAGYLYLLNYGLVFVLEGAEEAERRLRPVADDSRPA